MATVTTAAEQPREVRLPRAGLSSLLYTVILCVVGFLVLYPILLLFLNSFQVGQFGLETHFGFDNWTAAFQERKMREAIFNTLSLSVARQIIALVIGVTVAWLIARTNLPGRNWLEFGFWVSFFLPTLTITLGWVLLADGERGLLNKLLMDHLPFITEPVFDVFSWWGIVFVHLMTGTLSVKVVLLTPAFRNLDASLEEASRVSGASTLGTLVRIVIPVLAPAILVVSVLGLIRSMEAFEIELILGATQHIDVYSTLIYRQAFSQPPEYGTATALSMFALLLILPLVVSQQLLTRNRRYTTVSGQYAARRQDLGVWRWPLFGIVALFLLLMTALPVAIVLISTFMKLFGFFTIAEPWTLSHWQRGISDPTLLGALQNTLVLGVGAAVAGMLVFALVAYCTARSRYPARGLLDFLTWLPTTLPGVVIGLGFLWLFLGTPFFRPFYGSMGMLVLAIVISAMTVGVQVLKSNMLQLGAELEEASWASGASWWHTFVRIVLPLIAPALAVVGVLTFVSAVRATSVVALLSTRSIQPLSMVQLDYMSNGHFETASVIGVVILLLTIGVALIARLIGLRVGPAS